MIGRPEIQRLARASSVDERIQERDYVLAWLLAAMSTQDRGLVFKGGTCLRRCYLRGYRYSEDLDFTSTSPGETSIAHAVATWTAWIGDNAGIQATVQPDSEKRVYVSFAGPLGALREQAIKVDIAGDEIVETPIERKPLFSEYSDLPDGEHGVPCYSLAEIWAEKTRSLMQRSEARDLYDLAELHYQFGWLADEARATFERKARAKGLRPEHLDDRLDARESVLKGQWETRLRDQVGEVPPFEMTWRAVRRALRQAGY